MRFEFRTLSHFWPIAAIVLPDNRIRREKAKIASMDIKTALSQFLLVKDGKSDAQKQTYSQMQAPFELEFGNRQLSTITPDELLAHVDRCW